MDIDYGAVKGGRSVCKGAGYREVELSWVTGKAEETGSLDE